jgi:hypothetical protein
MRRARFLLVLAMMVALLLGSISAAQPQAPGEDCRYFAKTGHHVCGEFLALFKTRGELEIFGYPLTEAFEDPNRGLQVQYFQRARMELHSYNPEPYRVLLGLLVDELGYSFPLASSGQIPAFNNSLHHYFPETGHVVSYAFLDYFREHGGLDVFGYPRSEFMYENGYIVQYFQRVRMEWHPEEPSGPQMRLTNLGETYVERFGVPAGVDEPVDPPSIIAPMETPVPRVTKLSTSASVRNVITGREGSQTVFVYVTDQWQQPVQGAAATLAVHYQSGDAVYYCTATNASGFTSLSFDILPAPPGRRVVVDVAVTHYDDLTNTTLTGTTQTFFLPWW